MPLSACLLRRQTDQLGPPTSVRLAKSYTTQWDTIRQSPFVSEELVGFPRRMSVYAR